MGAGLGARPAPPRPTLPSRLPPQPPRPLGEFSSPRSGHGSGPGSGSGSYGPEPGEARPASQLEPDRRSLPRTPSACECRARSGKRGPGCGSGEGRGGTARPRARSPPAASLYAGSAQRSRSNSFGERPGGGGGGGARRVRALVSHSEGANHTLLRFSAGDVVEVLVAEAQNGWLYGKLEGSST